MKITLKRIPIRDVVDGYTNNNEEGVVGYGGQLDIRPKYQREFIYNNKQRDLVLDTINKGLPLNVMYWVKNSEDEYEVMDGQQRTISFASYVNGDYAIDYRYFHNLTDEEKEHILDYELMIYIAEGTDKQKLDWFKIINIAGEKLTDQELRNAVYTGPWLEDAKRHFSKTGCAAYQMASDYMRGVPIRQDYLETAIRWKADEEGVDSIEEFMAIHQHDNDANELWQYFRRVINWTEDTFNVYRREMRGIDWGLLYNEYGGNIYNANEMEEKAKVLMEDVDVTKKSGSYEYLLSGNERKLSIRSFDGRQKREAYERQDGVCPSCNEEFGYNEMEGDHITPWSRGGKTIASNCQMLCKDCNRTKGSI